MKKFKLMIPPDMLLIVPKNTRKLHTKTVEIVEENSLVTVVREPRSDIYHHVKRLWLEEIKDEPVTADEALEKNHPKVPNLKQTEYNRGFEDGYLSGFPDGEENERKRHQPKQSFEEWWRWFGNSLPDYPISHTKAEAKEIWEASEKNRGFDES